MTRPALYVACLVAWSLIISGLWQHGPAIEAFLFPPVVDISYYSVRREGTLVCWHTRMHQVRRASLQRSQYWYERGPERTPIAVYINRQASFGDHVQQLKPNGPVTLGPYCAELPTVFANDTPVTERISNVRLYRSGMPWSFLFSFPDIDVPRNP